MTLTRKTPLKRKASPKRRRRKATDNPERLEWVRMQPCARCAAPATAMRRLGSGSVEAHHPTGAGLGLRSGDGAAIPLCGPVGCHFDLHNLTGHFEGWTKDMLRRWQKAQSEVYQVLWEARGLDTTGGR